MRSRDDELWTRVNEALDAREDPLADPAVLDLLDEQPERAVRIESLTRAIEAIRILPPDEALAPTPEQGRSPAVPRRTSSGGRIVAAAAAAVLVIAALSYWAATRTPAPAPTALRARDVVNAFLPDATPITSWSVRVERREAGVTILDSLGPDGTGTTDTSTHESNAGSARIVVHSFTRHP